MTTVSHEVYGFVLSFIIGVLIAVVMEALSAGRLVLSRRPFSLLACEVVGVAIVGCLVAAAFLLSSSGQIRAYPVIGLVLGMVFYRWTVGIYVAGAVRTVFNRMRVRRQSQQPPNLSDNKQE